MNQRERFEAMEQRLEIFVRDCYICQTCGKPINWYGTQQLAHRISQSKANIKRYGKEVIHNRLNMVSVCSLKCNDAQNIGFSTKQSDELAEKIRAELSKE